MALKDKINNSIGTMRKMPDISKGNPRTETVAVFTSGPIWKSLIKFALPLFLGNILQQLYVITDSVIVGRFIGPSALAAIGASQPIIRLSISIAIGITLGVSVLTARLVGANDAKGVSQFISTCRLFFAALAGILTLFGLIFTQKLLHSFQTPAEILQDATGYLRAMFLGIYPMLSYNVFGAIFRGFGNAKMPLFMLVLSTFLNVILDLLAVLVFHLGVEGTAWATVLSQTAALLMAEYYFRRHYKEYYKPLQKSKMNFRLLGSCLKIGIPSGIKGAAYWGGISLLTSFVNSFGATATASFSVGSNVDSFLQIPLISLQMSLASFTAQNIGAGKMERVKKGVSVSLFIGFLFAGFITVFVYFLASSILKTFTTDKQVIELGAEYLKIVSVFYIIYAWQEILQGVAVGAGNTLILLFSTITAMWALRVPLAYFLSERMGIIGVWLSIPSGWVIATIFVQAYFSSGKWQKELKQNL